MLAKGKLRPIHPNRPASTAKTTFPLCSYGTSTLSLYGAVHGPMKALSHLCTAEAMAEKEQDLLEPTHSSPSNVIGRGEMSVLIHYVTYFALLNIMKDNRWKCRLSITEVMAD